MCGHADDRCDTSDLMRGTTVKAVIVSGFHGLELERLLFTRDHFMH